MTPEQHNVLAQLAQLGLQKLTETATDALNACLPPPPEVVEDKVEDKAEGEA